MKIRIGTRGSALAIAQTKLVCNALSVARPQDELEVIEIKTIGDHKQGTDKAKESDKKDWIYELELALLERSIDLAVHSGKDVPSDIEVGTEVVPVLERSDPFDIFIGKYDHTLGRRILFSEVPANGIMGTASLRRRGQLLRLRPDCSVVDHRGNVPTRIAKLDESSTLSGIILAAAGVARLGLPEQSVPRFKPAQLVPALNQGILSVQFRADREDLREIVSLLMHPPTAACWYAERAVAELLKGDCKSAIGIFATPSDGAIKLTARVLTPDGKECVEATASGALQEARRLGLNVGEELIRQGAHRVIERARSCCCVS